METPEPGGNLLFVVDMTNWSNSTSGLEVIRPTFLLGFKVVICDKLHKQTNQANQATQLPSWVNNCDVNWNCAKYSLMISDN